MDPLTASKFNHKGTDQIHMEISMYPCVKLYYNTKESKKIESEKFKARTPPENGYKILVIQISWLVCTER